MAMLRSHDVPCFYVSGKEDEARAAFAQLTAGGLRGNEEMP